MIGEKIKAKIITNDNEKISLSIREIEGNPFKCDELKGKNKGDVVTCKVIEVGDFGIKVKIGTKGPITVIKKNDLALKKPDCRPNRWARNDRVDCAVQSLDLDTYKINLSIKALEEKLEADAMKLYGKAGSSSGASLGSILGAALGRGKKEADKTDKKE